MGKKRKSTPKKSPAVATEAVVAPPSSPRAVSSAWAGFYVVLALVIGAVLFHAFLVDANTARLCRQVDVPGTKDADRMPMFLAPMALDGYMWDRHAEFLGRNGEPRLRDTDFDNAPAGREVHWNSAFAWYLRGLGEAYRAVTGEPLRNSIVRMSIWANPLLLVLALAIFAPLAARRFGPLCGSVIALGMFTTPSFYEGFLPAYPDHHGLIAFTILAQVFGIAWAGAGWVRPAGSPGFLAPETLRQARNGMIFSALSGAAGLWISAFSTAVVTASIGLGMVVANALFARRARSAGAAFHSELWILWAWVGGAASLGFYLLEYFPNHLGMRLEVNHPLYALAWFGGGLGTAALAGWLAPRTDGPNPFPWRAVLVSVAAAVALPATLVLGGARVYIPQDPFMQRLWVNIAELLPLMKRFQTGTLTWEAAFGLYPIFFLIGVWLLFVRRIPAVEKAALILVMMPVATTTALQFYQSRWGMLAGPLYIALAAITVPALWRTVPTRSTPRLFAGAVLALGAIAIAYPSSVRTLGLPLAQFRSTDMSQMTPDQALHLLHRDMARVIRENAGGKPVVLLSSPNSSTLLSALGGFKTIGTLYWENVDGLKAAAATLNAQSEDEALALIRKHGITHISIMPWENFMEPYFRMLYPKAAETGESFDRSFGNAIFFKRNIPTWLRPIIYPPNALSKGLQQDVLMFEVVPNQTRDEAQFHLGRYLRLSRGDFAGAEANFKDILARSPGSSAARVELVELYIQQQRFGEAVEQFTLALPDIAPDQREALSLQTNQKLIASGATNSARQLMLTTARQPGATNKVLSQTAWMLATTPNISARDPKAVRELLARLDQQSPNAVERAALEAAALSAEGRYPEALAAARRLEQLARTSGNQPLTELARNMQARFEKNEAWTDDAS